MMWPAIRIVVLLVVLSSTAQLSAETIAGAKQQVLRLNPALNTGKPAYTVADCLRSEHCLTPLVQEVGQAGGHIGILAKTPGKASPDITGENHSYSFAPLAGESFCKAVLLKLSVVPTFWEGAPEIAFSASRSSAKVVVRLPKPEQASAQVWFDGILILISVTDPDRSTCTLESEMREAECKGLNCETIRF
jgi:hypothetical protein